MEGHCSTGQSPQWAVVPMEEEEAISRNKEFVSINIYLCLINADVINKYGLCNLEITCYVAAAPKIWVRSSDKTCCQYSFKYSIDVIIKLYNVNMSCSFFKLPLPVTYMLIHHLVSLVKSVAFPSIYFRLPGNVSII